MSTFEQKLFNALQPKRSPVRKRRKGKRRGPWRSERYRRWIAAQDCLICHRIDVQAAHTENNGMRSKGPDSSCVPLCISHHSEFDQGRDAFERKYGVDMRLRAVTYFERWKGDAA